MNIRALTKKDLDKYWEMALALDNETNFMLFEKGEREQMPNAKEKFLSRAEGIIDDDDFLYIVEDEGQIWGYISATRNKARRIRHVAYIVIGIREKFRGRGVGSEFFRQLEIWAKARGVLRLELTLLCKNEIALKLYKKSGFEIEGVKQKSMLIDGEFENEYYMSKWIK